MKRDMDLIRKLLFYFDEQSIDESQMQREIDWVPEIEGYDEIILKYHLLMMYQAGFIDGDAILANERRIICVIPCYLTWQGHEFLEQVRNDTTWAKVKKQVVTLGVPMTFGVLKSILLQEIKQRTGLEITV